MKGMEKARIIKPGYAIEYDYFDPRDLKPTLETKSIRGLFLLVKLTEPRVMKKPQGKGYWQELMLGYLYKKKKLGSHVVIKHISVFLLMIFVL